MALSAHASVPVTAPCRTDAQNCKRGVRQWQLCRWTPQDAATEVSCKHVSRVDTCTVANTNWHKTSALVRFPSTINEYDTNQKKCRDTLAASPRPLPGKKRLPLRVAKVAGGPAHNACHFVSLSWLVDLLITLATSCR